MATADNYIQLSTLPKDIRQQVLDFIEFLVKRKQGGGPDGEHKTPIPGLAKGMVEIPDDFDDPLEF